MNVYFAIELSLREISFNVYAQALICACQWRQIMHNRNAQCNAEESPSIWKVWFVNYSVARGTWAVFRLLLPPFSLIRDFQKQNTHGNVSKISVNHTCYQQIGSKSTNHSPLAWRKEGLKVTLVAAIGGFRSDLSITRKSDGNIWNVSVGVLFSKVAYQWK